tara:strand:+ start:187 stop:555 length:369 start_codon:yes stop_codon:yes gene_type:complete
MNAWNTCEQCGGLIPEDETMCHEDDCAYAALLRGPEGDVISPSHYNQYAIQPIEFIMANGLDFPTGNIVKYSVRAGHKIYKGCTADESAVLDLEKVIRNAEFIINTILGDGPLDPPLVAKKK